MLYSEIRTYSCRRQCGWTRGYHANKDWLNEFRIVPLYGVIRQGDLIRREIEHHDCLEYAAAVNRLRKRQAERRDYDNQE